MTRTVVVVAIAALLSGCYTSSRMPAFLNLGGPGFQKIDCSRTSGAWAQCDEKAAAACEAAGGYYVLKRYEDRNVIGPGFGPVVLRTLYIRCFPQASDLVDYEPV